MKVCIGKLQVGAPDALSESTNSACAVRLVPRSAFGLWTPTGRGTSTSSSRPRPPRRLIDAARAAAVPSYFGPPSLSIEVLCKGIAMIKN